MNGRFDAPVESVLRAAGWFPGRRFDADQTEALYLEAGRHEGMFGGRMGEPSEVARAIIEEFGGLVYVSDIPGVDVCPCPFALDPSMAAYRVETVIDAGRLCGVSLYPVGVQGMDETILALSAEGDTFAIDPIGVWYLGESFDAALNTLLTGRQPVRVGDDGWWPGRKAAPAPPPSAGAAFFLPRTPANLTYDWLPGTLARVGLRPRASDRDPSVLTVEWGALSCTTQVLDLETTTVLVLAFDSSAFVEQREAPGPADPIADELPPTHRAAGAIPEAVAGAGSPGMLVVPPTPLARAFRDFCVALGEELDVAFVQTAKRSDLAGFVARWAAAVGAADVPGLLNQRFGLVYLRDSCAAGVDDLLAPGPPRDELLLAGGRLIFAGTGEDRW